MELAAAGPTESPPVRAIPWGAHSARRFMIAPLDASPATPAPLAALLPAQATDVDDVLSRFMSFIVASGLALYPAQEEALLELMGGRHVVLTTPPASGNSLIATSLPST